MAAGRAGHGSHAVLGKAGEVFNAYDCTDTTNRVGAYSLLEPTAHPTMENHHKVERTIFGQIAR